METCKPQDMPKQGLQPQDQDTAMELIITKHDDLRTARKGPAKTPD